VNAITRGSVITEQDSRESGCRATGCTRKCVVRDAQQNKTGFTTSQDAKESGLSQNRMQKRVCCHKTG
jgi:hypothetical protein